MRRIEFSPEARADLLDIADYIARADPERALTFVAELEARCAELLPFSDSGHLRPELAPELRSKPHGRYVISYTPGRRVVRVERILHGARDVGVAFRREGD